MSLRTGFAAHLFPRLFVLLAVSGAIALVACGSDNDAALADLAEGCAINSDCNAPLVCAFKECHDKCDSSRDCPDGQLCIASDKPFHVCQLPDETKCTTNSQCPTGEICGIDDHCRDACSSDRDCLPSQYCAAGTCADTGSPPVAVADAAANVTPGTPCQYNSNCTAPLVCQAGLCAYQCMTARDCAEGLACVGNLCVVDGGGGGMSTSMDPATPDASMEDATMASDAGPLDASGYRIPDGAPAGYGEDCALASDCPVGLTCTNARCVYSCVDAFDCNTGAGQCCSSFHVCVTGAACTTTVTDAAAPDSGPGKACGSDVDCQDGNFCDGYERCTNHVCQSSARACDDADPCTADTCNEAAGTCAHAASAPVDQDGDGHYAIACGSGADDCDDTNSNVYPGHPEVCDFVDNNCNNVVDEGAWTVGAPLVMKNSAGSNGAAYATFMTPGIVRLTDGSFVVIAEDNSYGTDSAYWHVSADLTTVDNGTGLLPYVETTNSDFTFDAFATDGTRAIATIESIGQTTGASYLITPGSATSLVSTLSSSYSYNVSNGALVWVPSLNHYVGVYSDAHLAGTSPPAFSNIFATNLAPDGTRSGDHELFVAPDGELGTGTDSVVSNSYGRTTRIRMSTNGSNMLVAWTSVTTNHARYALFDLTLSAVVAGPFDLTTADAVAVASSAAVSSGSYVLATSDGGSTTDRLTLIDGHTGITNATRTITPQNPTFPSDIHVAAQGAGIVITLNSGNALEFGYMPATLADDVGFTIIPNTSTTAASIAPVDANHVAIAWVTSAAAQVAMMTCAH